MVDHPGYKYKPRRKPKGDKDVGKDRRVQCGGLVPYGEAVQMVVNSMAGVLYGGTTIPGKLHMFTLQETNKTVSLYLFSNLYNSSLYKVLGVFRMLSIFV